VFFLGAPHVLAVTYSLWRWAFPRLPGKTFGTQVAAELPARSSRTASFRHGRVSWCLFLGAPQLFGVPLGLEEHITITPQVRQNGVRIYALLPIVPSILSTIITYHLVWRRMETLQTRARELRRAGGDRAARRIAGPDQSAFPLQQPELDRAADPRDPAKAEACVERLAEIFRYLLNRAEQEFVRSRTSSR